MTRREIEQHKVEGRRTLPVLLLIRRFHKNARKTNSNKSRSKGAQKYMVLRLLDQSNLLMGQENKFARRNRLEEIAEVISTIERIFIGVITLCLTAITARQMISHKLNS